jgi:peptidoglycan/LPS O-acetylase OafA/YrhL
VKEYLVLHFFRGVSAIGIVAFHTIATPYTSSLYLYVDFFFVLSGFLLQPKIYNHKTTSKSFIIKRIVRLAPIPICVILIHTLMLSFYDYFNSSNKPEFYILNTVFSILLLQIFVPSKANILPHLWSVSAELWVNIFAVITKISSRINLFLLLLVTGVMQFFDPITLFDSGSTFRAFFGFYVGIITKKFYTRKVENDRKISLIYLPAVIIFQYVSFIIFDLYGLEFKYICASLFSAFLIKLVNIIILPNNFVIIKFFNYLGDASFPLYLIHVSVLTVIFTLRPTIEPIFLFWLTLLSCFTFIYLARKIRVKLT